MGIVVKPKDLIFFKVNSISAFSIRANISFRPSSWWARAVQAWFGPVEPYNLTLDLTGTTDRSLAVTQLVIREEGEIDAAIVVSTGGVPASAGECFIEVTVARIGPAPQTENQMMCEGYLYNGHNPSFPGRLEGPRDGPGRIVRQALAQPAAGADYANTAVPTQARWKPQAVRGALTTAVAAANRQPGCYAHDGTNILTAAISGSAQPASLVCGHDWGWDTSPTYTNNTALVNNQEESIPLWKLELPAAFQVRFITFLLQAADQWSAGSLTVEEWISP